MRDAIAQSMMAGTQDPQTTQFAGPPISLAQALPRAAPGAMMRPTVGSARPAVFAGGGAVTPTPTVPNPTVNAGNMAAQGVSNAYRYNRLAQAGQPGGDAFSRQNDPWLDFGVGSMY